MNKQIFISYAHIDNKPVGEKPGWISRFHESLEAMLSTRLGYPANIWRDDRLQGNDIYADEIMEQLQRTEVIISILSPRYLNSFWCSKEATEFYKKALEGSGVRIKNKSRFFKVIKTPFPKEKIEALPQILKDIEGYEFFTYDNDAPIELDEVFGKKFGQDFRRKICQLSWNISNFIESLGSGQQTKDVVTEQQAAAKPIVYLAQCSYDLRKSRDILKAGLKLTGYTVLPDRYLPTDEEEYIREVERLLSQSKLSIHLVGNSYGAVPDGSSQKSLTILQNELAVERSKKGNFSRFIWSPESKSEDSRQQAFIDAVHEDATVQYGADLLTGDLEEFKSSIHSKLAEVEKAKPDRSKENGKDSALKLIYLICDQKDRKATIPVRKFLRQQGFDVEIPVFEGDATKVREANKQLLIDCDGILLFYGAGCEAWKRSMTSELRKMQGYREGNAPIGTFTYLAEPRTDLKEDFIDMEEANLIDGLDGFSEEKMTEFVQAMKSEATAS